MSRCRSEAGYALLAALVVTALAALFAATAVAAVAAEHQVGVSDRGGDRADQEAWQALDEQAERLRLRPWLAEPPLSANGWRSQDVTVWGEARSARSALRAVLELRLPPWCGGLVTGGDAQLDAPVTVVNSGACIGGSLRGREQLRFGPAPSAGAPAPADLVHGELWPLCAAHALGGIWAGGVEIHEDAADPAAVDPSYSRDTDTHSGDGVGDVIQGAASALLAALHEHALSPGTALDDGVLDVSLLPAMPAGTTGEDPAVTSAGYVVFLPAAAEPVRLIGQRAAGDCPLALMVQGDAQAGAVGRPLTFRGALVVCGHLDVEDATSVDGSLFAGSLEVAAPLTVTVQPDWRAHPLAGLAAPVITQLARG